MSDWRLRPLNPEVDEEFDIVTRFAMTTILDTVPEFENDPERVRKHFKNYTFGQMRQMFVTAQQRDTHHYTVGVDGNDVIVGHSMIHRALDHHGKPHGYYFTRYVVPEWRRKGIASALLTEAEKWFSDYDLDYLQAHTHAENKPLLALFRKHKYWPIRREQKTWPVITLRKVLVDD